MKKLLVFMTWLTGIIPGFAQQEPVDTLRPAIIILNPVELKEVPVIGKKENVQKSTPSTEEVLKSMEGISLIRRGNFAQEPVYRGMSGERLAVTIDGMKIFGACTDKMDPVTSYIEPNNLLRAKLYDDFSRGENGGATAGNLDFKLRKPVFATKPAIKGGFTSSFSSISKGYDQLADLEINTGKYALRLNGSYRNHQNYTGGGESGEIQFSQFEKFNVGVFGKILLNRQNILSVDYIKDEAFNVGYPALPMDVAFAKADISAISWKHYFRNSNFKNVEAKAYMNLIRHAMDDSERPDVLMKMDMPGESRTMGAFVRSEVQPAKNLDLVVKADFWNHFSRAEMTMYPEGEKQMFLLTWPDVTRRSGSFYAGVNYGLSPRVKISGGGRAELASASVGDPLGESQFSIFGYDVATPRDYFLKGLNTRVTFQTTEKITVFISGGISERMPEVSEAFGYYIFNAFDGYNYVGNPGIDKEKATEISLGINGSSGKLSFKGELFYNRVTDFIIGTVLEDVPPMTPGANGVKVFENLPYGRFLGGEAKLEWEPHKCVMLFTGVSYVAATGNEGNPLPLIPPLTNNSGLKFEKSKFFFVAQGEFAASQERISLSSGETATPGYAIFNLRAGYRTTLWGNGLEIKASLENLFNSRYYSHLDWGKIPRPGRNMIFSIKYHLKKQF